MTASTSRIRFSCAGCTHYKDGKCLHYASCKAGKPLAYPPPFFERRSFAPLSAGRA